MSLRVSANRARAAAVVLLALIAGTLFAPPSAAALDVPGPVENLTVAPGDGMIYASRSPPTNTGGSEILEYTMTQSVVGTLPTRHTFVTVLGLTPGSSHTMTVVARNAQGSSAPQTVTVTVGGSPRALPAEHAPMKAGAAFSDYVGTVGYPAPT